MSAKPDRNRYRPADVKTRFPERDRQTFLVDRLEKTGSQLIVDLEENLNNPARQFFVPSVRVRLCSSVV